uniref:Protein RFT1 homolog n=1 Tax=Strigamia maritima TaxID=126957 RepID=T1J9Y2_STRMM
MRTQLCLKNGNMNSNNILTGAAESLSYNVLLQIFFRLQTFILNGFILRFISKDVLGIINVRIFLLYSTITFLSTEAFTKACMTNPNYKKWHQIINLIWLTVPTSILCSLLLGYVWLSFLEQPEEPWKQQYWTAVIIVEVCCVLERLVEPLHIVSCVFMFNKLKVFAQCISIAAQCVALAAFVYMKPEYAIYGFCVGQVLRSSIWPSLSSEHSTLTYSFLKQGLLKQILTEGERYIMTVFNILNFGEQGVYDVISNLGSLAARFLFRPIEESGYQFFAQTIERNKPLIKQNSKNVAIGAQVLHNLFKMMVLIGGIIMAFGFPFSHLLLQIYGGNTLTTGSGPNLLRWNCVYVGFLAINGISECYAFATMRKSDIDKLNYKLLILSVLFLCLSWYLTKLFAGVGFILANCTNMAFRILNSIYFIKNNFELTSHRPLHGLIPHPATAIAVLASFCITSTSEILFCCYHGFQYILLHIVIGLVCLVFVIVTIYSFEKSFISFICSVWKKELKCNEDLDIFDKLD